MNFPCTEVLKKNCRSNSVKTLLYIKCNSISNIRLFKNPYNFIGYNCSQKICSFWEDPK